MYRLAAGSLSGSGQGLRVLHSGHLQQMAAGGTLEDKTAQTQSCPRLPDAPSPGIAHTSLQHLSPDVDSAELLATMEEVIFFKSLPGVWPDDACMAFL